MRLQRQIKLKIPSSYLLTVQRRWFSVACFDASFGDVLLMYVCRSSLKICLFAVLLPINFRLRLGSR